MAYTENRLQDCSNMNWFRQILNSCDGDKDAALRNFFEFCDGFKQVGINQYWKAVLSEDDIVA